MKLTTQDGNITVSQSTLSGQSTFKSTSGEITFSGSLYANGITSLKTDKGGILITLPANATFHVDATVQQGNITSAFPLTIKSLPNGGSQVNQDRGAAQPKLTLEVNQGYIKLQTNVPYNH